MRTRPNIYAPDQFVSLELVTICARELSVSRNIREATAAACTTANLDYWTLYESDLLVVYWVDNFTAPHLSIMDVCRNPYGDMDYCTGCGYELEDCICGANWTDMEVMP